MRILFLIGYFDKNNGGHFHSLHHISSEIAKQHEVHIISIGSCIETIVNTNENYKEHLDFNGKNIFSLYQSLKRIKQDFKPDVVHFFDKHSFVLYRALLPSRHAKLFVHVCGGPNPKNFPMVQNLVLFSIENKIWFESQSKFSQTKIYLIPNRVHEIEYNLKRQTIRKEDGFNFVRISRIGSYYKKSLLDSINLINKLTLEGKKCRLYIIGFIEDEIVFKELKNSVLYNAEVVFLTEKEHTNEASQMLYLADAVIATGRSIMEATSLGLPVLTPIKNINLPALVTNSNFDVLFATNFSERNLLIDKSEQDIFNEILALVDSKELQKKFGIESKTHFKRNFDIKFVPMAYQNMYDNGYKSGKNIFFGKDIYFLMLSFYKFTTLYKKQKNV